jgi:hypothetical protein
VKSKLKCDEGRPCGRCRKRGIDCPLEPSDSHDNLELEALSAAQIDDTSGLTIDEARDDRNVGPDVSGPQHVTSSSFPSNRSYSQPVADWDILPQEIQESHDSLLLPSFFEQIMVPIESGACVLPTQQPPNISMLIPDHDDWLTSFDIFDSDFGLAIDLAMDGQANSSSTTQGPFEARNVETASNEVVDSAQRHAILQRSS